VHLRIVERSRPRLRFCTDENTLQRRGRDQVWVSTQTEPEGRSEARPKARLRAEGVSAGKRCSIPLLFERVRWFYMVETTGDEAADFKINNNFASRYARLIMENEPDLHGLVELSEIRTA
jgi:hypothetical protein